MLGGKTALTLNLFLLFAKIFLIESELHYYCNISSSLQCSGQSAERGVILGIDQFGYLRLRGRDGTEFSVFDDGNSFDMMRGLIRPKV
jgi:hypothetical protein